MISSLLVPIALFSNSARILGRVGMLPLADDARISLLHVVPDSVPREARERAANDAQQALEAAASKLAGALGRSIVMETVVRTGNPAAEIVAYAQAMPCELIVVGRVGARGWKDLFVGSTAEQVIRNGQVPVLVVHIPARAPYRHPAVAIDFDEVAHDALAFALRIVPAPRPAMTLVHAYDAPFQGLVYSSFSPAEVKEYRRAFREAALRRLKEILADVRRAGDIPGFGDLVWAREVRLGSPRTVVPKAVAKRGADLLVLGTNARSGLSRALLGTVAGDILREVACDVLVVPPKAQASVDNGTSPQEGRTSPNNSSSWDSERSK